MTRDLNITNLFNFQMKKLKETEINLDKMNALVALSLQLIIVEFFMEVAASFVIVVSSRTKRPYNLFLHILQDILNLVDYMNVQIVFIDHKQPQRVEGPRRHNLLLIDSYEAFLDIDIISYTKDYDASEFYHIFLMQKDELINEHMQNIFNYCWSNQIINCNIQFQNARGDLHLYTYFPFDEVNSCGNTQPQHINQFVQDNWLNRPYFLPKTNNFYGCPLLGVIRSVAPYVYINPNRNDSYEGFEVEMVKEVARILNFTLELKLALADDRSNPTENGALSMLNSRSADFVFGYYRKHYSLSLLYTNTNPHYQSTVLAVICLRAHLFNTFQVLFYPFRIYTWCIIIFMVLLSLIITKLAHAYFPKSLPTFSMISIAFGIPIKEKPKYWYSHQMFTACVWGALLLRSIYVGLLYHFFSNDIYLPMPKTLEMATNGSYAAVSNIFTAHDLQDISYFKHKHHGATTDIVINSTNDFVALEYLEKHTDSNLYAVISEELLMYYIVASGKISLFYVIPDVIMQEQLCIYFPKHTILAEKFDVVISNLQSIGYRLLWKKRLFDSKILSNLNRENLKMITQQDLYGIYIICGACHLAALMVLLLEMLSMKIEALKIIFK